MVAGEVAMCGFKLVTVVLVEFMVKELGVIEEQRQWSK